jgi:hypothetical protein
LCLVSFFFFCSPLPPVQPAPDWNRIHYEPGAWTKGGIRGWASHRSITGRRKTRTGGENAFPGNEADDGILRLAAALDRTLNTEPNRQGQQGAIECHRARKTEKTPEGKTGLKTGRKCHHRVRSDDRSPRQQGQLLLRMRPERSRAATAGKPIEPPPLTRPPTPWPRDDGTWGRGIHP